VIEIRKPTTFHQAEALRVIENAVRCLDVRSRDKSCRFGPHVAVGEEGDSHSKTSLMPRRLSFASALPFSLNQARSG